MEIAIVEKGATFDLEIASKGKAHYYVGAGWDNPNGPVDLDLVCCLLVGGVLTKQENLVYFGNRFRPGVKLSEDNTTGEGEGDDESLVIDTRELDEEVDGIVIGLACYSAGADLKNAPNPHFRVCDGDNEAAEQMADVKVTDGAEAGDTVLQAVRLNKGENGWTLENIASYAKCGNGGDSIKGFAAKWQS